MRRTVSQACIYTNPVNLGRGIGAHRCETGSPPDAYDRRALDVSTPEGAPYVARELTKWKDNQKWKTAEKWKTNAKWKSNQKWRQNEDDDDVDDEEEDKSVPRRVQVN